MYSRLMLPFIWALVWVPLLHGQDPNQEAQPDSAASRNETGTHPYDSLLQEILQGSSYSSRQAPRHRGKPCRVQVSLHIRNFNFISDVDMTVQMDFLLRHVWQDRRLEFDPRRHGYEPTDRVRLLAKDVSGRIFLPDTHFR